tara:strand:+ start:250 stop:501 length:252 start_codon:yes stop_codon:yes gene_type:complete
MIIQTETRAQHKTIVEVFHSALENYAIEYFEAWQVTLSKVNGLFTVTIDDVGSTQREDIVRILIESEEDMIIDFPLLVQTLEY